MPDNSFKHRFSADRAITSRKQDLLGRSDFANSLSSAIRGWKGDESLVIALYGPWGSGKSSVKNMAIEALHESKGDCPQIVEFNPWQWAGHDQLVEAFFREIGIALGKTDTSKEGKQRAAKWRMYGAYLKAGSYLIGGFRKFIICLLVIVAAFSIGGSFIQAHSIKSMGFWIGVIAFLLAGAIYRFGAFAEKIASVFEARSEVSHKGLLQVKQELTDFLKELKRPILVVIDDVDRLSADEIRLLFQLIKANADFPHLVYLLLFQRDIVENSLDRVAPTTGREFLDKIVQVGFNIPEIERPRLEKVLFTGLNELVEDKIVWQRFNEQRWANIFISGLRPYFETLRDIYRFLGTLSFHIALFRSAGGFEVNPIDLIALEVLRVFEPEVYQRLPEAKAALMELRDHSVLGKEVEDQMRAEVESIVKQAPGEHQPVVREILKQLFPPAEWILGGSRYGTGFADRWFRDLRICHSDVFDRYFHFAIPVGDISQTELDRLLSLAGDPKGLVAEFRALNERGLLGVALNRLEAYKERIDLRHAVPFITALFDIGDELPEEPIGLFAISADTHASRIIYWYLKQEEGAGKRFQILKEAMQATTGLYLPVMTTSLESDEQERKKDPGAFTIAEENLKDLQSICVEKITQAAESGVLKTHPQMAYLLYRWREWVSPEIPKKWVGELIESEEGTLAFLVGILQRSSSQKLGDYVARVHWRIKLKNVEDFIPVDVLQNKVKKLQPEGLGDKEQKAVRAFQKAIKRRQEGKADDDRRDDEDE